MNWGSLPLEKNEREGGWLVTLRYARGIMSRGRRRQEYCFHTLAQAKLYAGQCRDFYGEALEACSIKPMGGNPAWERVDAAGARPEDYWLSWEDGGKS